ncbi:hypothetical protein ACIGW3_26105 [Streptomyces sp. NPDC053499]|uniref:hypothetical protein n=1 Tax=Streptomyces sp. NPDC053499 TaxID=3365707 RepID=UPI0037CE7EB7
MTETPYTDEDLRAEAARQHVALTKDPDFMGVGEQMDGRPIPSTIVGLAPESGEPSEMSRRWHQLDEDDFDAAQRKIHKLISSAADVSAWAVDLGADGLEPEDHTITLDGDDTPLIRVHLAFRSDMSDADRQHFAMRLGRLVAKDL